MNFGSFPLKSTLARTRAQFARTPIYFQFAVLWVTFTLSMFVPTLIMVRPHVNVMRVFVIELIARVAQMESARSEQSLLHFLERLNVVAKGGGLEGWVVDQTGTVLASTDQRPLPLDWSALPQPEEEFTVTWGPRLNSAIDNLCVVRLLTGEPRFLVVYFHRHGTYLGLLSTIGFTFLLAILIGGTVLVWLLTRSASNPSPEPARSKEAGFSLISGILTLVVVGISMLALQSVLTLSLKGTKHTDLSSAARSLSDTIRDSVSCEKTMAAIVPATDCADSDTPPKPILLLNSTGAAVTSALNTAATPFNPLDNSFGGAGKLGSWSIRAYCEGTEGNLIVRYARPGTTETFLRDPLTKRYYDWQQSNSNPLFGTPDRILCKKTGGGSSKPMGYLGSRALYRNQTVIGDLRVQNVPPETKFIKIYGQVFNYMTYPSNNELSEDHAILNISVDLVQRTSTGYYGITGGTGLPNVSLFTWENESFAGVSNVDGWTTPTDPSVLLASRFRPSFDYSSSTRTFTMLQLPRYAPSGNAFMLDFYGEAP